jgi:hypothetical protein
MSQTPYKRKQGDFELRILRDGRLVMVAPDESLMEIAKAFEVNANPTEQHLECNDAEAGSPGSQ